jgi:DNA-3-methyladenine glycosylase
VLYGPPGRSYVYLIYGTSCMFNASCQPDGTAAGVLVRALEPAEGVAGDTDGPGKLTAALGITLDDNDRDLCSGRGLWIEDREEGGARTGPPATRAHIVATPRINIGYAGEWILAPYRFVDARSPWLSKRLPGTPRRRGPRPRG